MSEFLLPVLSDIEVREGAMRHVFTKKQRFVRTRSHWTSAGKSSKKRKIDREIEALYDNLFSSLKKKMKNEQ